MSTKWPQLELECLCSFLLGMLIRCFLDFRFFISFLLAFCIVIALCLSVTYLDAFDFYFGLAEEKPSNAVGDVGSSFLVLKLKMKS